MLTKIHKRFNFSTQLAISEIINGYVDRKSSMMTRLEAMKLQYKLDKIYRFDLGENADGFSPLVDEYLKELAVGNEFASHINEYPETSHVELCEKIAKRFGVKYEHVVLATGSECFIDIISRMVFKEGDLFIWPTPSFFLFNDYSSRCGAKAYSLELDEVNNFAWTIRTTEQIMNHIFVLMPKLVWIANPNNPTGQIINMAEIEAIVEFADNHNVFVVIDEAYGEFMDTDNNIVSAASLLSNYENLIVLRTFSKVYGLAGMRLGYLLSSSQSVVSAILSHRNVFPVTQLSLIMANKAFNDEEYLIKSRNITKKRKAYIAAKLSVLPSFKMYPSSINVFLLKSKLVSAGELDLLFNERGVITSPVHIDNSCEYLRITVRCEEENEYFCEVCEKINNELLKKNKYYENQS